MARNLELHCHEVTVRFLEKAVVPPYEGSMIRGAFGRAFKESCWGARDPLRPLIDFGPEPSSTPTTKGDGSRASIHPSAREAVSRVDEAFTRRADPPASETSLRRAGGEPPREDDEIPS